jgi:hypothetical protein
LTESDQTARENAAQEFRPLADEPNPFVAYPRGVPWREGELPLDGFSSEQELADRVVKRLEPWFVVQREVRGTHCTGRRLRIDAMIRPKEPGIWRNPDVAFGLEFKVPDPRDGIKVYTRWIAQAVDYTHVDWDGYGRRIILTCPGVSSHLRGYAASRDDRSGDVLLIRRIAGQLGIGELVLRQWHGLTILVNEGRIWSERRLVGYGKHWTLTPKYGSR